MAYEFSRREMFNRAGVAVAASLTPRFATAAAAATPAKTMRQARIINTAGNFAATMTQLMKDQKYLEEMGIDPQMTAVADGSKIMGALLSGGADICIASGFGQVLPAIERGGHLKIVAGAEVLLLHEVFSKKPEIKTVKDLKGRTIGAGAPGALLHTIMVALLRKKGVDPETVKFVDIGSSADVFRAVVAGVVDAGPAELDYQGEEAKFGVHALADGKFWRELPEFTNQASYVSQQAINERRDVLVCVLAAYSKLYGFLSTPDSKEAYIRARAAALGKNEPTAALTQWNFFQKHKPFDIDLTLSSARIKYMQALNVSLGVQKRILPEAQVVDMSLARDARARLRAQRG